MIHAREIISTLRLLRTLDGNYQYIGKCSANWKDHDSCGDTMSSADDVQVIRVCQIQQQMAFIDKLLYMNHGILLVCSRLPQCTEHPLMY